MARHLCLGSLVLRRKRLRQAVQRPAVVRVAAEVLAIDCLCLLRLSGLQQRGAQQVPHRKEPIGRFVIRQLLLFCSRLGQQGNRIAAALLRVRDARLADQDRDRQDIARRVQARAVVGRRRGGNLLQFSEFRFASSALPLAASAITRP